MSQPGISLLSSGASGVKSVNDKVGHVTVSKSDVGLPNVQDGAAVASVNGQAGDVTLTKASIGLPNVADAPQLVVWQNLADVPDRTAGLKNIGAGRLFDTVTALLAIPSPKPGEIVHLNGYYAAGDGGGGVFCYASGDESTPVDGGTILAPSVGGRMIRQHAGEFDIRWFGADPTAVLDSRNAIQAALNAARQVGGKVIIPPGDFRVVQSKPLFIGTASIEGRGGKLWNSLPDGYTNPNTYGSAEPHSAGSVLDENGDMVTFDCQSIFGGSPFAGPWNGKGLMFSWANGSRITNLRVDGGWGTTSVPGSVQPITGIRDDTDEFTFYQMFYNSTDVLFQGCQFTNAPGAYIEIGQNIKVLGCSFGEFGDHVFYVGQDLGQYHEFIFSNNTVLTGRSVVGTLGQATYVGNSRREILKFRGNNHLQVAGNIFKNSSVTGYKTTFCRLEVNSAQPGDCRDISITGNTFEGEYGIYLVSSRTSTVVSAGHKGFKIRNVQISGNSFLTASYALLAAPVAVDGLTFEGNRVTVGNGPAFFIFGDLNYEVAVKDLVIRGNWITNLSGYSPVVLGGRINQLSFAKNKVYGGQANFNSSQHLVQVQSFTTFDGIPTNNSQSELGTVEITDNEVHDLYSLWFDGGFAVYDSSKTYGYVSQVCDDDTYEHYAVVGKDGVWYRNTATVDVGVAPPSAPWEVYTPPACRLILVGNFKSGDSSVVSPDSVKYWTTVYGYYRHTYNCYAADNIHWTAGSDPVGNTFNGVTPSYFPSNVSTLSATGDITVGGKVTATGVLDVRGNQNGVGPATSADSRWGLYLSASPPGDGVDASGLRVLPHHPQASTNPMSGADVQLGLAAAVAQDRAAALRVRDVDLGAGASVTKQVGILVDELAAGTNNTLMLLGSQYPSLGNWSIASATTRPSLFNGPVNFASNIALSERSDPTGVGNTALVYARDNGAGKTELCVQFNSGSPIVLATEA